MGLSPEIGLVYSDQQNQSGLWFSLVVVFSIAGCDVSLNMEYANLPRQIERPKLQTPKVV
jgi:hypothetical protein